MAEINWEKCIDLANKRLRDVITAANKAVSSEMLALMTCSICGEESEIMITEKCELTLNGDQVEGIYFTFQGYNFHITKDSEYNSKYHSDLYHIWCECKFFDGEEMPMSHTYVNWLCGGDFLEEKHKAFIDGQIPEKEFVDYLYSDVNVCLSTWLENNKEKISEQRISH